VLLDELRRAPAELPPAPDDAPLEERWRRSDAALLHQSLGNALAFTADRSHFDAIVELIEDPRTGAARPFLIELYLARFRGLRDRAVPVLRRLLADDDLGRYALKPLAKLRAVEARAGSNGSSRTRRTGSAATPNARSALSNRFNSKVDRASCRRTAPRRCCTSRRRGGRARAPASC
jgi:hypothetical protein